jgi:hypothetical protein
MLLKNAENGAEEGLRIVQQNKFKTPSGLLEEAVNNIASALVGSEQDSY